MEDIHDVRHQYEQLGTYLRIQESDIQAIICEESGNAWIRLKRVIVMWLNRNTIASEIPNRRILVEAIRKINNLLAIQLEEEYNRGLLHHAS